MLLTAICWAWLTVVSGGVPIAGIDLILAEAEWQTPSDEDVEYIAKTIHGEAGICSELEKSAVAWCILNRVDCDWYPDTVKGVVTQPHQFHGYTPTKEPTDREYEIARQVLSDWLNGFNGRRTLPSEYIFFHAVNRRNVFTTLHRAGKEWDWSMADPYSREER